MLKTLFHLLQPWTVRWAAMLALLLPIRPAIAQTVAWSGVDAISQVNSNWSDANNWSGGTPRSNALIYFFDAGTNGARGVANNIVSSNTTIFSLEYGNTNGFHTTQISAGARLTISNNGVDNFVYVGTKEDNGANQSTYSTMTGLGSLKAVGTNTGSLFVVQQGAAANGTHMATLDLSGLANVNLSVGRLMVGGANPGSSGSNNWLCGTLYLAGTNTIRVNGAAPAIDVGDSTANGGTNFLYLGQTNAIFADSMTIAHSKATATLAFNPALAGSNPTVTLNGNTNARMSTLAIGDFSAQTGSGSTTFGTANLAGGTANVLVDTCYVGRGQTGSGAGPATGTLRLGAGVFNANTLNVGYLSTNTAAGNVTGTLTLTNGTMVINNNLVLAYDPGAPATASGTLNLTTATVLANNIAPGGGTSKINLSGGWLAVTNMMGSPAAPLSVLTVSNSATLQFWVANGRTNVVTTSLASDHSGAINIAALPVVLSYPSAYPLIFCPTGGLSGITFSLNPLPGSFQGFVSNDNSRAIWLVVTNGPPLPKLVQWGGGVNRDWDTNTLNWTNNGVAVAYRENDFALFDDSAQTNTVNLAGLSSHTPYTWTVSNNIVPYKFIGSNSIAGQVRLVKSGNASLTLAESGDSFSDGLAVNGGAIILDQASNAISGGLVVASGAAAQVGNNDANGSLPAGTVINHGALVFSQTITNLVATAISGGGSVIQDGSGAVRLSGANSYTGDTVIRRGTLALLGSGTISSSANVIVSNATFDVSGVAATAVLGNLNMTNGLVKVGTAPVSVAGLNLGGTGNTLNVAALPPVFFYPTNFTLIQSASSINGYNFALGTLPAGNPAYDGSLAQNGNAVVLTLAAGPIGAVLTTVSFSATNAGLAVNPAFSGLSYEKSQLTGHSFVSNNTSLLSMFSQIAPAVLRIGGNSVDTTCWGGVSNKTPITAAQVDAFAGFVKALPTNWQVIYGINMSVNSPTNCAAEAAYAANALGASLLGFEIGNECDLYAGNGIRATNYTYSQFLAEWRALVAGITNTVPGWAITNGGNGWTLTGPVSAFNTSVYTVPFARNETGVVSMVTQHYYRANGQSPSSTLQLLLQPDTSLPGTVSNIVAAANTSKLPQGFRMNECGSFYNGGAPNVSDAYGTALWTLDFMFTIALQGGQGVNFHGGGSGPGYTPIADNGTIVLQARPEFYGLKLFSLASDGRIVPATVSLTSNINFTAYGVRQATGGISAVLVNKETNHYAKVTINLGTNVTAAHGMELAGPSLDSTSGYTLGGAVINPDGSWVGGAQWMVPATNGQLTVIVSPISAVWLDPIIPQALPGTGTNLSWSVTGQQLALIWPSNYIGWLLQSNATDVGMSNNWFTVPGSAATNRVQVPIDPARTNVFYRMLHP